MENSRTYDLCQNHLTEINGFYTTDKSELDLFYKKYSSAKGVLKELWNEMKAEKAGDGSLPHDLFQEKYKALGSKLNEVKISSENKINTLMPVIENVTKPQVKCLNDIFDQALVNSGKAKDLREASSMARMLYCSCPKCSGRITF